MMKLKGTITVFLSFLLVFVTGLFFTMSEVVRYYCLQGQAERAAALACESTMADYCRPLWEQFGILAIDGGYGEAAFRKQIYDDRLSEYMEKNGRPEGTSLLAAYPATSELADYHLLTDASCAGLVREAAEKFQEDVPEMAIKSAWDLIDLIKSGKGSDVNLDEYMTSGKKAAEAAKHPPGEDGEIAIPDGLKTAEPAQMVEPDAATQRKLEAADNPIESVGSISPSGNLWVVLQNQSVSGNAISDDRPSKRARNEGTAGGTGAGLKEEALFKLWTANTLQSYRHDCGRTGLLYETEYVICGKNSDRENLEGVVDRILLMREGINFSAIVLDPEKNGEAEALAWIIAGPMAPYPLVLAIKAGIIASWAYVESVLEVRLLLNGGRVSLVKTQANWTTSLWLLSTYIPGGSVAIDSKIGLSYTDFLRTMLIATPTGAAGLRVCDIMESAIRQDAAYANFRADNCIYEVRTRETYQAKPMFLSYVLVLQGNVQEYTFEYPQELSYIT